jgi:hypothetical protein
MEGAAVIIELSLVQVCNILRVYLNCADVLARGRPILVARLGCDRIEE